MSSEAYQEWRNLSMDAKKLTELECHIEEVFAIVRSYTWDDEKLSILKEFIEHNGYYTSGHEGAVWNALQYYGIQERCNRAEWERQMKLKEMEEES